MRRAPDYQWARRATGQVLQAWIVDEGRPLGARVDWCIDSDWQVSIDLPSVDEAHRALAAWKRREEQTEQLRRPRRRSRVFGPQLRVIA